MFMIFFVCLFLLIIRLGYWQILKAGEMQAAVTEQQNRTVTVAAPRGTIYDRNGKALAESATVNTLICNPQEVAESGDAAIIADELSVILDMDYKKIHELLNKGNRYQVIKKRLSIEESKKIENLKNPENDKDMAKAFSGIGFEEDSKRYYSYNVAPHIMGFTGYDNNGLQGIELTFDNELSGKNGGVLNLQTGSGTIEAELDSEAYISAQEGADIVLTIDETIQHYLESHLEEAVADYELKEGAAGIVMNPKTGEILAMATKPDFDLNSPYEIFKFENNAFMFEFESESLERTITSKENELLENGEGTKITVKGSDVINEVKDGEETNPNLTKKQVETLMEERTAAMRNKMWRNKAISDAYEPGSTFKIITAAAALEEGVVSLDSEFVCTGSKRIGTYNIGCHKSEGHGAQNFAEGVLHSCNPVFMETGLKLGSDKFMEYFSAFGLTQRTGIELVGEADSIYYKDKELSDTDIATSSFGQGFNVTPVQMITAVSAAINGGSLMRPQIVKEIRTNQGVIKSYQPEVVNKVISEDTSKILRELLEQVVSAEDGTGRNAYIKGYSIGGKTGTSEKGDRADTSKRIASFVGFAPANDPEIICLVMLDEPQVANKFGGTIAAPLAGEIIEDTLSYLGVQRDYEEEMETVETIEIVDVRDIETEDAKEKLEDSGFTVKVVGKGDTVYDQLPKPGIMMSLKSTVILYTDEGKEPEEVKVPDVEGMSFDEARNALKNANLNFEAIGAGQNTASGAYAVKQSVAAGHKVLPATVIGVEFRQQSSD